MSVPSLQGKYTFNKNYTETAWDQVDKEKFNKIWEGKNKDHKEQYGRWKINKYNYTDKKGD